ncbi:hypothetical protein LSH36_48g05028 [Paralvinella palmiformis]|uniref:Inhibitor of growth protein n=1 Tax=Paralvinella palmiformis TaxID=53620 RepID=A0AAD9K7S0_9ANNE|nr:hypothetical protein LSH36_48g05028 [Paralvinella palmiformis]
MMSVLNHAAVEALCSATYLENYLDCMENLPDDLQRVVTQLRELDSSTNELVQDILHHKDVYVNQEDGSQKKKALIAIQRKLIKSQELGDEKLALVSCIIEHVENRTRQLEQDLENLDPGMTQSLKEAEETLAKTVSGKSVKQTTSMTNSVISLSSSQTTAPSLLHNEKNDITMTAINKAKRQRRQRAIQDISVKEEERKGEEDEKPKKKKKRKTKKDKGTEKSPVDPPIDPDEPTYCLCEQVSYGEMIGCDYDKCQIEWFHFNCVGLTHKPKGKWFCPKCRGDKPTVLRTDLLESLRKEKVKSN